MRMKMLQNLKPECVLLNASEHERRRFIQFCSSSILLDPVVAKSGRAGGRHVTRTS